ncbi:helix-turn-helix domain-containing protein [Achromobacter ruhlandii]|uniref:helix-turn-helix domain-containing protein n=1 Tax=Achromobacter ruhlandii TaxID=72557 RepID=UPI000C258966|nr:helix-turn-helix domain-containing protein [Achromobacter ruhlandii]PJM88789.1 helix-turn-helix transcriptional regulator [Achromobacter ruhlandii]
MSAKPAFAPPRAPAAIRLSPRESASLHWSAIGKTSWETARILDISESTVNFHLRNACRKLQVRGRRGAVATAIRRGLLHPVKA